MAQLSAIMFNEVGILVNVNLTTSVSLHWSFKKIMKFTLELTKSVPTIMKIEKQLKPLLSGSGESKSNYFHFSARVNDWCRGESVVRLICCGSYHNIIKVYRENM